MAQSPGPMHAPLATPLCALEPMDFPWARSGIVRRREFALNLYHFAWMPGTELRYYFINSRDAGEDQKDVVRWAFRHWQAQGIALSFREVSSPEEAQIRIAFDLVHRRSNSRLGTECQRIKPPGNTMLFGWPLNDEWGHATALHEIGHAIGLSHEHQHPLSPLTWDEPVVLAEYKRSLDWDEKDTRDNIINKVPMAAVGAIAEWDVTSIMHYPFKPGLIKTPELYRERGTPENTRLSERDIAAVQALYPLAPAITLPLGPTEEHRLELSDGGLATFEVEPTLSRSYQIKTVGRADARMALFERTDDGARYLSASDNHGTDGDASLDVRLTQGTRYLLHLRKAFSASEQDFGIVMT